MSNDIETTGCCLSGSNMSVKIVAMSHDGDMTPAPCNPSSHIPAGVPQILNLKRPIPSESVISTTPDEQCLPIVYGNEAQYVAKANHLPELPEGHTHRWTVYVRAYHAREADALGKIIRKVVFVLEPHYRNESVDRPPFIVSRTGWGEFAVKIRIYFHDVLATKPLVLSHDLRLVAYHTPDRNGRQSTDDWSYVPFVREEKYDEIVVFKPTPQQQTLFEGIGRQVTTESSGETQVDPADASQPGQHEPARVRILQAIMRAKKIIEERTVSVKTRLIANQESALRSQLRPTECPSIKRSDARKKRAGRPKKGIERIVESNKWQRCNSDEAKSYNECSGSMDALTNVEVKPLETDGAMANNEPNIALGRPVEEPSIDIGPQLIKCPRLDRHHQVIPEPYATQLLSNGPFPPLFENDNDVASARTITE